MILGYNFIDRTATVLAYDGTRFTTPFRLEKVTIPVREGGYLQYGFFDWKSLIADRKVRVGTTADEATAAMKEIREWPDCDDKLHLISILQNWLSDERIRRKDMYIATMIALYGERRGRILSKAIHNHELVGFPAFYLREDAVANLVNFLVDRCCGLASAATPTPYNSLTAVRSCQFFSFTRHLTKEFKGLIDAINDGAKIRAAFIAARLCERRE